jgi:hypothetical protein
MQFLFATTGTPSELALVRMTADSKLPEAERHNYRNVVDCLSRTMKEGGITRMWTGATPTIARAIVLSSTMLASYSEFKGLLSRTWPTVFTSDGLLTMFCGTMMASLVTNTVVNPLDVVKSRVQARPDECVESCPLPTHSTTAHHHHHHHYHTPPAPSPPLPSPSPLPSPVVCATPATTTATTCLSALDSSYLTRTFFLLL